ncbi:cubilin-like isoform X2 [Pomacea canaliculata]|nr:cubilin-like isoform X2 [Pomacea canaliculata]
MHVGRSALRDDGCPDDVITAYDGPGEESAVLHTWCGRDKTVGVSTGSRVLVVFIANRQLRYRGFALKYSLVTLSSTSCREGKVRTIPLDNIPVILDVQPPSQKRLDSTCSWRLVPDDSKRHVVLDLETYSELDCSSGNFSIYDGLDSSSPELLTWCARRTQPFSSFFLPGSHAFLVFRWLSASSSSSFRFIVRTRPSSLMCNDTEPPLVEVKHLPVFLGLPFAKNTSGDNCPVRIVSHHRGVTLRVDVLETDGQPAGCDVSFLDVVHEDADGNITKDDPRCTADGQTVYWLKANSVILSPAWNLTKVLIRVVPLENPECQGRVTHDTAPSDEVLVITQPPSGVSRSLQYANNAWCRYLVSGERETDHVTARVTGEMCEQFHFCGDYVRLYDGNSTDSPLLYDSGGDNHISVYITSRTRYVMMEIWTDDRDNYGFVRAEFNSVPDNAFCQGVITLKATREANNLTSVNYPNYYPVNYLCHYCITSDDNNDIIYADVLDADLTYTCLDFVEVYDGNADDPDPHLLGRFCAQSKPSYVSSGPSMCLLFRSDAAMHGKGWLLSYRAGPPQENVDIGTSAMRATTVQTAVLGVLLALVTLGLITTVIVTFWKTRSSKSNHSYHPPGQGETTT